MNQINYQRLTGLFFIAAAVLFGIAATALSMAFEWPDILREDPDYVLTKFEDGGTSLILIWLAVAWTYGLLLVPIVMLSRVFDEEGVGAGIMPLATVIGTLAVIASVIGFLRWVFVMPDLTDLYFASDATQSSRDGVIAAYTAQHQYGGTLLGEHVGQTLSVVWSALVCAAMMRSRLFPNWLAYFGFAASGIYFLNQGEIMETAIDGFPVLELAGLLGSTLWALWILATGAVLVRARAVVGRPAVGSIEVAPAAA